MSCGGREGGVLVLREGWRINCCWMEGGFSCAEGGV